MAKGGNSYQINNLKSSWWLWVNSREIENKIERVKENFLFMLECLKFKDSFSVERILCHFMSDIRCIIFSTEWEIRQKRRWEKIVFFKIYRENALILRFSEAVTKTVGPYSVWRLPALSRVFWRTWKWHFDEKFDPGIKTIDQRRYLAS